MLTLAHELGHGLHADLARDRGVFEQHTPLTLAETASVFGETLVFARLLDAAETPESRLALLAENIEGSIATVFRQVAMNRFEELAHTARRDEGELSVERFGELWEQSQEELLGDAVEVTDGYKTWWSYVPHFIGTPGLRVRLRLRPAARAVGLRQVPARRARRSSPKYIELLSAGGSQVAGGAGRDRRPGPHRPGLLARGPGPRARPARAGREAAEEVLAARGDAS